VVHTQINGRELHIICCSDDESKRIVLDASICVGITGSGVLIAIKWWVNSFGIFRDVLLARKIEELQVL
jgi:hypothetical protein